jgi:hypothetical protein
MLFCDNCNGGYHLFYLKPELTQVPIGSWYCPSCSPITPWLYLDHAMFFPTQVWGGDTWEFHLRLLLCIVYIGSCICFWLISFYLWLVLVYLFSRIYYGFTPLQHRMSQHYTCRNPTLAKCGGEAQHFQSWGFGVLRDSWMFRVRQ